MIFEATIQKFEEGLWSYYIALPDTVFNFFKSKKIKRVLCSINTFESFHAGLMPLKGGSAFIKLNQKQVKLFKLSIGLNVQVCLEEDLSTYGMAVPEVFAAFLDQDEIFNNQFHALTPGKQRTLLHLVQIIKSPDSQIMKTTLIAHHLKKMKGKLDFKILYQDFKD